MLFRSRVDDLNKCNTYTLIKLSVSAFCHLWVVSPVYFSYVISFDVLYFIHGQIAGKRYRQVISQCCNTEVVVLKRDEDSLYPAIRILLNMFLVQEKLMGTQFH